MSYLVLARKWRPKTFSSVIGQTHVLQALINGLDQDRLHHAFLFSGTRGVGKTTLARILAKSLNCEKGVSSTPCGKCNTCQEVDDGRFVDLIEVDAASRTKVDDTRELLDNVQYAPSRGRYKVYLIDEVHMLSTSSFNALLKTLEEPPPHVKFLFATTDPQKLPVTILSRCLQFNLRRLDIGQISSHLSNILEQEEIAFEQEALLTIAKAADGSMRDALSLLDQAITQGSGQVQSQDIYAMLGIVSQQQLYNLLNSLIANDAKAMMQQTYELAAQGRDFVQLLNDFIELLQRIATVQAVPDLDHPNQDMAPIEAFAKQIDPELLQLFYQIALHGKRDLAFAANPKSGFEMILLRLLQFQPSDIVPLETIPSASPSTDVTPVVKSEPAPVASAVVDTTPEQPPEPTVSDITSDDAVLNADNWLSIINGLKLTALARQLADNSAFVKFSQNKVTLSIAPELAHLANAKSQGRLESALSKHLDLSINLAFEQQDPDQVSPTLATERTEQAAVDQERARASIHADPAIEAIKSTFGAQVIESTIKPIK